MLYTVSIFKKTLNFGWLANLKQTSWFYQGHLKWLKISLQETLKCIERERDLITERTENLGSWTYSGEKGFPSIR